MILVEVGILIMIFEAKATNNGFSPASTEWEDALDGLRWTAKSEPMKECCGVGTASPAPEK